MAVSLFKVVERGDASAVVRVVAMCTRAATAGMAGTALLLLIEQTC